MTRAQIVGDNIRKLRNARGMTQVEFAHAIQRSQSVVAQYESGQRLPSTQIMGQIANVFGVTFDAIYNSEEEKKPHIEGDWYGEYFGYSDEPTSTQSIELTPEEVYLIRCYRDAESSAQMYALQMLENNPAAKEKSRA